MSEKREISSYEWCQNTMALLQHRWALLSVGTEDPKTGAHANTMTVSWGGVGVLWNKPVCFVFVRPQRYTKAFMEKADRFSLCFLPDDEENHKKLAFCGKASGRDVDKFKTCGLTGVRFDDCVAVQEAETTLICKKLYAQDFTPEAFLDKEIEAKNYPFKDYHKMYIGEIEHLYVTEAEK